MHPGGVPLEESLEGMFLALRNKVGEDLTDPAIGFRFGADWKGMVDVILDAAREGKDPFKTALFPDEEFSREKAFLAKDREVYRQDVLRGERWIIQIEGGPKESSGLFLRHPKSLLFKNWSRQDHEAPVGGTYLFLAVLMESGNWVFSTDPVQRLSIRGLAEALEEEESRFNVRAHRGLEILTYGFETAPASSPRL